MKVDWLPKNVEQKTIFGMDAFRGIAAFLVLLFHFWTFYLLDTEVYFFGLNITAPFAAGHLGVDIFFVISGFLIFLSVLYSSSIASYFKKRFWRIFPLAAFFTITVFFLKWDFSSESWKNLWAHIFFVQAFFESTYHGLHPVMWTLSVEALFYILLPLLLFFGRKKLSHFWGILLILLVFNFWYRYHVIQFFPDWMTSERIFHSEQMWGRFDQFVLGILLGNFWIFRKKWERILRKWSSIFLTIGIAGFFTTVTMFSEYGSGFRDFIWMQMFLHFFVAFFFALFLLGFLFARKKIQKIFAPKSFLKLGVISYSIYLWHFPVISVFAKIVQNPTSGFILTLVFTLLLSVISYFFLERPFLLRKKRAQ